MTDRILNPVGSEANNDRGARFEDQLSLMGKDLGWRLCCRNVDIFVEHNGQSQSKGVDILWAIANPITGEDDGLIHEAKVHGEQRPGNIAAEATTLHGKIDRINKSPLRSLPQTRTIRTVRSGLLSHRTNDYVPSKSATALGECGARPGSRGIKPRWIGFTGPDRLNALADAVLLTGKAESFYWPSNGRRPGTWSPCAPPRQVAHGMLVYRVDNEVVLWTADTLTHLDAEAYAQMAWHHDLSFDRVICSFLSPDDWAIERDGWRHVAEQYRGRRHGRLPDDAEPRDLSLSRLNRFDDLWPAT